MLETSENSFEKFRWVWKIAFNSQEDVFKICWTEPVIQHISLLRERFVQLKLEDMIDFNSSYTFRLYEILITSIGENSYKNPKFSPEVLMEMMDVPESCLVYKTFRQRVLTTAVRELKVKVKRFEKLEMVEEKEKGKRKVIRLEFVGLS